MVKHRTLAALLCVLTAVDAQAHARQRRKPIIDMHAHAHSFAEYDGGGPVCANDQKIVFHGL